MTSPNTRVMKLQKEHRPNGSFFKILPALRLAGKLLEKSGFFAGEMVVINYEEEKLTITTQRPAKEYLDEKHAERMLEIQKRAKWEEFD